MPRPKRLDLINPDLVKITCPMVREELITDFPQRVTIDSPLPLRCAVFRLAQCFRREFGYDGVQYGIDGRDRDPNHVAYLWVHPDARGLLNRDARLFTLPAVGAACFRWREWSNVSYWAMQCIWIFPYYRRRCLLSEAWPLFRKEFGNFLPEPPYSPAMEGFLRKHQPSVFKRLTTLARKAHGHEQRQRITPTDNLHLYPSEQGGPGVRPQHTG